ncbi:MAG: hypothetical protein FWF80_07585 [Defluviitaleaceae bacterium]|nr:hypothetical protein [Defluviitaleaceae bacterium]
MTEILASFAEKHNILLGVCDAAPLERARLASPFVPFVSADAERRMNPAATLAGAKSIIVVGVEGAVGCANLSSLGTADDYHVRVKGLLRELVGELKKHAKRALNSADIFACPQDVSKPDAVSLSIKKMDFKHKILVDSPGLDERALAHRAGLGFFGRNGLLISEKFGSRFNIGCLLLTLSEKPQSARFFGGCLPGCEICIKSCPNGALGGDGFCVERCVSYLTQKDELSPEEENMLHGQLFGCDICQDVCPFNAHMPPSSACVDPAEWLKMGDDEFEKKYGRTGMLWRGTEILRRNARIANRCG